MRLHHGLQRKSADGFTLVELSIVLVIIGLLVGGILVGRDLIRAAELRSLVSEEIKMVVAVNAFKLKYNCVPGDCANATDYFGTDPAGCPAAVGNMPKTQTCNGDGDSILEGYEVYTLWQHLSSAGLWSGIFRGSYAVPNLDETVFPPVRSKPSLYWLATIDPGIIDLGDPLSPNVILLAPYNNDFTNGFMTSVEGLAFDSKYDDGKPATGNIQAVANFIGSTTSCTNPSDQNTSQNALYDLTQKGMYCLPVFNNPGF